MEFLSLAVLVYRIGMTPARMPEIFILSQRVTLIGELVMTRPPAGGFMMFGAGFLLPAGFMIALLPRERPLRNPVSAPVLPGLLCVRLGVNPLGADRG